jgi:hypothetical protein
MIKTYAGAANVDAANEEAVDKYIKDSWELIENMEKKEGLAVNIHILNSMVLLYANAIRSDELEAIVLPKFE